MTRLIVVLFAAAALLLAVAAGAGLTFAVAVDLATEEAFAAESRETYQGKPLRWWAAKAVQNKKDANARGRTIKRLKREARVRWAPTVDYAYRLAATVYGVPASDLRSVGGCESHHDPFARNGRYRGVMQEGPMFERGPFGRAGFSVWDPVANVLTAAHARVRDGSWRQWECKP